jgi:hypothetical protein
LIASTRPLLFHLFIKWSAAPSQNVSLASELRDQDVSYSGYQPTWDGKSVSSSRAAGVYLKETVLAGAIRPTGRLTAVVLTAEHRLGSSAHASVTDGRLQQTY